MLDKYKGISCMVVLQKSQPKRGTWVAQSTESLTLDFHSGHDFRIMDSSPTSAACWVWSLL